MAIAGGIPAMLSTCGLSIRSRNWRAYGENVSTYRRWPSAYTVSKASDDFPDPDTPVTTVRVLWGISKSIFFRLWTRAPWTTMDSVDIDKGPRPPSAYH